MKTLLTLHASMTDPTQDLTFRDIDRRDRQHGFSKIGYHFVIQRDGTVSDGRTHTEASVHDHLRNAKRAISVCLVGGVNQAAAATNNFTDDQYDALKKITFNLIALGVVQVKSMTLALTDHEASVWTGLPWEDQCNATSSRSS